MSLSRWQPVRDTHRVGKALIAGSQTEGPQSPLYMCDPALGRSPALPPLAASASNPGVCVGFRPNPGMCLLAARQLFLELG